MILHADFCGKFVQAIRIRNKVVELQDGTTISILRNGLWAQQRSEQENIETPLGHGTDNKTLSARNLSLGDDWNSGA